MFWSVFITSLWTTFCSHVLHVAQSALYTSRKLVGQRVAICMCTF